MRGRKPPAQPGSAFERGVGLLARREHSTRELKIKLSRRGFEDGEIADAVDALRRDAYQSDERYAEVLVRHRASAGYGPRYIDAELRSHGLDPGAYRAAYAEHDWQANALAVIRRRYPKGLPTRTERDRAVQLLVRRGFPSDVIRKATGADPQLDPDDP